MADDVTEGLLLEALMSQHHAPMTHHDPRDGSCVSCPWPLHELGPEEIAQALLPTVRKLQAWAFQYAADQANELVGYELVDFNPYRSAQTTNERSE